MRVGDVTWIYVEIDGEWQWTLAILTAFSPKFQMFSAAFIHTIKEENPREGDEGDEIQDW